MAHDEEKRKRLSLSARLQGSYKLITLPQPHEASDSVVEGAINLFLPIIQGETEERRHLRAASLVSCWSSLCLFSCKSPINIVGLLLHLLLLPFLSWLPFAPSGEDVCRAIRPAVNGHVERDRRSHQPLGLLRNKRFLDRHCWGM